MEDSRRLPLSIDEILERRKRSRMDTAKLVFLSLEERRKLTMKGDESHLPVKKGKFELDNDTAELNGRQRSHGDVLNKLKLVEYSNEHVNEKEREMELEKLRKEKLGLNERVRRRQRSDKSLTKPTHWDDTEDTSEQTNYIYRNRVEYRPQFGTGLMGGVDLENQVGSKGGLHRMRDAYHLQEEYAFKKSKEVHYSHKLPEEMTSRDWRIFREDYNITTKGTNIPNPIRNWSESGLPEWLLVAIRECGYKKPSPIQMQGIPIGLQNRDLIGIAETGSGKTAAFLLPLLANIHRLPLSKDELISNGPYGIILAPSRELVKQIEVEAKKLTRSVPIHVVSVVGGADMGHQILEIRKGAQLIVATPGRLIGLIEDGNLVLNQCRYVVLDEGDQMMDMGFEPQVLQILGSIPLELKGDNDALAMRQEVEMTRDLKDEVFKSSDGGIQPKVYRTTTLFSATMPPAIERLVSKYLRHAAHVHIGEVGHTVDRIKQVVHFVKSDGEKRQMLKNLVLRGPKPPIIVFLNQKMGCDSIGSFLTGLGFVVGVLHSNKSQDQRERVMEEFRNGDIEILVATNVAGRGLDVNNITHVINYDLPKTFEEYTHRIGRTGRAGKEGLATSFLTKEDTEIMPALKANLLNNNAKIPQELLDLCPQSSMRAVH